MAPLPTTAGKDGLVARILGVAIPTSPQSLGNQFRTWRLLQIRRTEACVVAVPCKARQVKGAL